MKDLDIQFPLNSFEKMIIDIGWDSLESWLNFWDERKNFLHSETLTKLVFKDDWIWGLALPIISDAFQLKKNFNDRKILGISALPGTGKTTLGNFLKSIATKIELDISVISLDDFYLPAIDMDRVTHNNPWNVSRGYPGTHSIGLIKDSLLNWKETGKLKAPVFDKSLRSGLGDRSYWIESNPDILIFEGWFLGVNQYELFNNEPEINGLTNQEIIFRGRIQREILEYQPIWELIDKLWQLKPKDFKFTNLWKKEQESEMFLKKGSALLNQKLVDFQRMINTSIPVASFDSINSDILAVMNQQRKLEWIGLNNKKI